MSERTVRFEKWEGLGNDFALIDDPSAAVGPDEARRLCDRRRGIGADGVLLVQREGGRPRMIVYNADGSRPEMCGNGLRCVAAHLVERDPRATSDTTERALDVITDAGDRHCLVRATAPALFEVTVEMGVARRLGDLVVPVGAREHRFLHVDVGNPHAISFDPFDDADVDRLGPAVSVAPPGGINVEFCRVNASGIAVTVWERGVGRTLACGTGACAVAAAACETGRAAFGRPIRVTLPGGPLEITVTEEARAIRMRGPARRVFSGEVGIA
jgi:diaminopimelate epimerase